MVNDEVVVTPWEVKGDIDYDKLVRDFGTQKIGDEIISKIEQIAGEVHPLIKRKIFFSHRDLDWLLSEYEKGNKFFLYTGRGPSGDTHLGHLVSWILTKWFQDKFGAELWFQMTDDEKFYFKDGLTAEFTNRMAYENALDVIALGFDEKKTFIFSDFDYAKTLYPQAAKVAKKLTFSTARAVFGFNESSNVGQIFFTSMQSVPAFLPSIKEGKNIPCLIPHAIDQDPHFRVCRDILPKLGYYKPAAIHSMFLPGLKQGGKMSSSIMDSAIFTTDTGEQIEKKVKNAFTGGKSTAEEQRKTGANPDICSVYNYYFILFMWDDNELGDLRKRCLCGEILCGDCKKILENKIKKFLNDHQKKREEAKKRLDKFILRD
ncbi:MAG: tryptophan--tRNA ligase [Candidatus Diapherotrites archaeon]|nr:tryptophan--tRNA ligase [Candidatus Diapherotrites archaeon]